MAKSLRDIRSIQNIDIIIEVVDARCINLSSNQELSETFHKPKLTIALKSDLVDIVTTNHKNDLLIGSIKKRKFKDKIIEKLDVIFAKKKQELKLKGLVNPQFYGVVVGLPNVGKSSLINFLATKTKLIVANKPGVTRNKQLVKINNNYFLYDTPGILFKKISNDIDGYKLALVGVIRREVLPLAEVVEWGYTFLKNNYSNILHNKYKAISSDSFSDFIQHVGHKFNFVKNNSQIDIDRTISFLYDDWKNNIKVNYEK
jgi:ribosome biogenesis GTPase A